MNPPFVMSVTVRCSVIPLVGIQYTVRWLWGIGLRAGTRPASAVKDRLLYSFTSTKVEPGRLLFQSGMDSKKKSTCTEREGAVAGAFCDGFDDES